MTTPASQSAPTPAQQPALVERADIHKSCKAVEGLLGIFNEYCEAVGAIGALQKRLAKALREAAGVKGTGEIAVNAMYTSATLFEALAEVDAKFGKVADKEYDSVSTEVKKWFKRLAKEERNHDEKMATANAKIKQAGQNYEKKTKKKSMDVSEEHARYINLISTLGPEMALEKYNHALNVTQKHSSTIYGVAASLSRLADSEWQKSCECVRRFSPTIGPLGQWKALCEGGWTGSLPSDLPNVEGGQPSDDDSASGGLKPIQEEANAQPQSAASAQRTPETRELELPRANAPPGYSTGPPSASASSQDLRGENPSAPSPTVAWQPQATAAPPEPAARAAPQGDMEPPRPPFVDPNTGSVRSLSAFPSPPTHFPIPPVRAAPPPSGLSQALSSSSANLQFPSSGGAGGALADSPVSAHSELDDSFRTANQNFRASGGSHSPPPHAERERSRPRGHSRVDEDDLARMSPPSSAANEIRRPIPVKSHTSLPPERDPRRDYERAAPQMAHRPSSSADLAALRYQRPQYDDEGREFGVMDSPGKSRTVDGAKYPRSMERTDTGTSTGSLVAAMRNRYSYNSGSISPPPRDLPRIPMSVTDLASRYEPADAPLSPRLRAGQSLPPLDTARAPKEAYQERTSPTTHRRMLGSDEERRQRQQERQQQQRSSEDIAVLERKVKEQELHVREQELEARSRELDRERARLQSLREDDAAPALVMRPRERRTSLRHQLQRPLSQMELGDALDGRQKPYSSAQQQLAPPLSPIKPLASPKRNAQAPLPSPRARERERRPESPGTGTGTSTGSSAGAGHAANCGCETCSVSKYSAPPQGVHQRVDSKPDKPRSWMRRLSMPVGNALGLDSSKRSQAGAGLPGGGGTTNFSLGSGVGNTPAGGRGLFSMDGKKNASTTALSSRSPDNGLGVREDGKAIGQARGGGLIPNRKSYEMGGISNRSMTNLGITGRH